MTWIIKRTAVVRDKMKNDSTKPVQAPLDVVAKKWTEPRNHSMRTAVHKGEEKAVAKEKEIARRLYDIVSDTLKAAVGEAKSEHKKVTTKT